MAATATLALLVTGATIGLEVLGLLFQGGATRQTIARIEAQEIPLPDPEAILLRPLEALDRSRRRRQGEPEQARRAAEFPHGPGEAVDEERYLADALRWAERYRQRREAERRLAALEHQAKVVGEAPLRKAVGEAPLQAEPRRALHETEQRAAAADRPQPVAERVLEKGAGAGPPPTEAPAEQLVAAVSGPEPARSHEAPPAALREKARHPRARSSRAGTRGDGNVGWPFLAWLQPLP